VQHPVKHGLGGRAAGVAAVDHPGRVERQVDLFAVQLPGQATDAGAAGHVHPQHLGAEFAQPRQARVVARGGDHPLTGRARLADELQTDAARGADDQNGSHGRCSRK
jgi:hypothetical protein